MSSAAPSLWSRNAGKVSRTVYIKRMWVAVDTGGLSNRIKGFLSALRVDPNARIMWMDNPTQCDCAFTELFVESHPSRVVRSGDPVMGAQVKWNWRLEVWHNDPVPADFSAIREFYGTTTGYRDIDFEYVRIPLAMREIYLSVLHATPCLQIQPAFKQERERFYQRYNITPLNENAKQIVNEDVASFMIDSNTTDERIRTCIQPCGPDVQTVAVHIRSWNDDAHRHETYFDFDTYVRVMDAFRATCPYVRFVVAADDPVYVDRLKEKYGADVVLTVPQPFPKQTMNAFLEMLVLSRLPVLVGTFISTFSELIWWYGRCLSRPFIVRKA